MLSTEKRRNLASLSAHCSIIMRKSLPGLIFAGTSPLPQQWQDTPSVCSSVVIGNSCSISSGLTFCSILSAKINKRDSEGLRGERRRRRLFLFSSSLSSFALSLLLIPSSLYVSSGGEIDIDAWFTVRNSNISILTSLGH